jgi:hypothetical protein
MHIAFRTAGPLVAVLAFTLAVPAADADKTGWLDLSRDLSGWKEPHGKWLLAADAGLKPENPKQLVAAKPGTGVLINGPTGRTNDLLSKQDFGDLEAHIEFMVAKRSNSGVKFHAHYEIQIFDSFGVKNPTGEDCGGIYPRAELKPKYHYLDKGIPPRVNAARPAGEWQTLDVIFLAPRFDATGKKTTNARILRAVLNGQVIHDNVELLWPTGHNWQNPERATGPLMLQGDHGPVAFRNIRVRPYAPSDTTRK